MGFINVKSLAPEDGQTPAKCSYVNTHVFFWEKCQRDQSLKKCYQTNTDIICELYFKCIGVRGFMVKINKQEKTLNDFKPPTTLPDKYRVSQLPFPFQIKFCKEYPSQRSPRLLVDQFCLC